MKGGPPFKAALCIACEDIRDEKSGKHSLMGVYSGDILISAMPGIIPMSFYLEIAVIRPGKHEMHLRFSGPGKHSANLKAEFSLPEEGRLSVVKTPRIDLLVEEAGTFRFDMSTDGKTWDNLISKEITLMGASHATSFLPPSEQSPPDALATSTEPASSRPSGQAPRRRLKAPARPRSRP